MLSHRIVNCVLSLAVAGGGVFGISPLRVQASAAATALSGRTVSVLPSQLDAVGRPPGTPDVGWGGGTYDCAGWSITIPAGAVPDGGYLHCGGFNPAVAPSAPPEAALLQHTINVNIYNPNNEWVTQFNPALEVCWPYTESDVSAAGGSAGRFAIQTAAVGGGWKVLPTAANGTSMRICAQVADLNATLFDLSVTGGSPGWADGGAGVYVVQPGDTLYSLAKRYGTTVAAVRQANRLTSAYLYVGQRLIFPGRSVVPGVAAGPAQPVAPAQPAASGPRAEAYVVQPGDTLYSIAARFGTTVAAIQSANNFWTTLIRTGQTLTLPGAGPATAAVPAAPPVAGTARVPVIEYHFTEFVLNPQVMMTTEWFDSQLQWLADNGYTTLSADQFVGLVNGTYAPPPRAVVLAFDVGTSQLDNFAHQIMPRLRQRQMRAILFVLVSAVNDDCSQNQLCWSVLRDWQAEGIISIGSHGVSHPDYARVSSAQMWADAGQSKAILEAQMGVPITLFAFPFDSAPGAAAPILQSLGYQAAVAGNVGGDRSVKLGDSRRYALPRYYPYSGRGAYPALVGSSLSFGQTMQLAVEPH